MGITYMHILSTFFPRLQGPKKRVLGSRREHKNPVIKEVEAAPHEACER